ncbi:MAG: hypothetical protein PHP62_03520 [Candidatus Moranbacteria bacterium]|nr:hypothetical protein [Candidatus Moranbacteria bacterium]
MTAIRTTMLVFVDRTYLSMRATEDNMRDFYEGIDIYFNTIANVIMYANTLLRNSPDLPEKLRSGIKKNIDDCILTMQKIATYPEDAHLQNNSMEDLVVLFEENAISLNKVDEFLKRFIKTLDCCLEDYGEGPDFFGKYAICVISFLEV